MEQETRRGPALRDQVTEDHGNTRSHPIADWPFPFSLELDRTASAPSQLHAFGYDDLRMGLGPSTTPTTWELGMMKMDDSTREPRAPGRGRVQSTRDLAERLEGYIELKARGRIRDLHVVCSEDMIILQGRSRTYHAKQLAQQAALDFTDGHTLLTNQIEVC
jgi:hypothetical protein